MHGPAIAATTRSGAAGGAGRWCRGMVTAWLRPEGGRIASVSHPALPDGSLIDRGAGERLKGDY
jgi:hypothetical protein